MNFGILNFAKYSLFSLLLPAIYLLTIQCLTVQDNEYLVWHAFCTLIQEGRTKCEGERNRRGSTKMARKRTRSKRLRDKESEILASLSVVFVYQLLTLGSLYRHLGTPPANLVLPCIYLNKCAKVHHNLEKTITTKNSNHWQSSLGFIPRPCVR